MTDKNASPRENAANSSNATADIKSMMSPRERAEARAAEILGNNFDDITDGVSNKFYIDPSVIPDGWTYEWKSYMVMGATDPSHEVELARRGWEAVPSSRHPDMMPVGSKEGFIIREGLMLMERPAEITARARAAERQRANAQVRAKEAQLSQAAPGEFERVDGRGAPTAKISKSFTPVDIPD